MGERWRHREEHDEHIGVNVTKRVTNLSKNICLFSFTFMRFIEIERREVTVKKSFEKKEGVKQASTRLLVDRFTLSELSDSSKKVDPDDDSRN